MSQYEILVSNISNIIRISRSCGFSGPSEPSNLEYCAFRGTVSIRTSYYNRNYQLKIWSEIFVQDLNGSRFGYSPKSLHATRYSFINLFIDSAEFKHVR